MHPNLFKLLNFKFEESSENLELKNAITQFCSEWLSGKEDFKISTSGSTGEPKIISISRAQMKASAQMTLKALNLKNGDESLVSLNTNFIGGKMMLVRGLEAEMKMTIIPPVANPLQHLPSDSHFDFGSFVPYQLQNILQESPDKLSILNQMKAIIVGGAPVSPQLEEDLQSITAPVYSTYGMTETVSHIALKRLNGKNASDKFQVLPGIEISTNKEGCLTIKGPVTNNFLLETRDLVEIISPNEFIWIGRTDNIINSGGIKIQSDKVERVVSEVFNNLSISNRHFIYGLPDEYFGTVVSLVVEGNVNEESKTEIYNQLKGRLGKYEIPKKIIEIKKFIETASGKVDRRASMNL